MEQLMQTVNLETMSTKQFIAALSSQFGGVDLSSKKKFIKATITEIIDSMDSNSSGNDDESEDVAPAPKNKRGGGGGTGGLQAVKEISEDLANFLGTGRQMARTEIVKALWSYIKENNLQNPENKREIMLDAKMQAVFGVDCFNMFTMNKYVSAHIEPYKAVDLTTNSTPKKRKAEGEGGKKKKRERAKQAPGSQAPYRLSDDLTAVTGKRILPRPQVTQALWKYIRENGLQNPEDKREINCDELLSRVMGGESKVTMFSMNKYITPHLVEKLDKSEYVHEEPPQAKDGEEVLSEGDDDDDDEEE
ncbi:predicted protein [Thalassiosira pseudonana CCMP1335]|uniref:DM2 domain-containing protein n=1 Tax=Thalassiosira pseudonana TaxID=35128 RepID=B8BYH9_THAPS|nr:predicted protein [Thalassiosira pseudonana CCMP1335]EED94378.1 predicted protein [Thalassiosira pseudonana CCMP1335]